MTYRNCYPALIVHLCCLIGLVTAGAGLTRGDETAKKPEKKVVKLRVLTPSGRVLSTYPISQKHLTDPSVLWPKLPDGRYQIVTEEQGKPTPKVVRDVELKKHKVIRRFDDREEE